MASLLWGAGPTCWPHGAIGGAGCEGGVLSGVGSPYSPFGGIFSGIFFCLHVQYFVDNRAVEELGGGEACFRYCRVVCNHIVRLSHTWPMF